MAGIESSANSTSVEPSAMITTSIGVITRLPFSLTSGLTPCHVSVDGSWSWVNRISRFSLYSSSSSCWVRVHAV